MALDSRFCTVLREPIAGTSWIYTYDLRGNLTKKYDADDAQNLYTEYFWDSSELLTKVHVYDAGASIDRTVEYKYDFAGRRVAKRVDGGVWNWSFYDGLNVAAEGTGQNDKIFYTNGAGGPGGIICRDANGTKYWYHCDRLGSVMAVTDANGALHAAYTMDAFGNILEMGTSAGYSSEHATDPQPYHLTTKEYDADAGLYYFNARWYDCTAGRWISREPTGVDGPNLYHFGFNRPPNGIELDGLSWRDIWDGVVGIPGTWFPSAKFPNPSHKKPKNRYRPVTGAGNTLAGLCRNYDAVGLDHLGYGCSEPLGEFQDHCVGAIQDLAAGYASGKAIGIIGATFAGKAFLKGPVKGMKDVKVIYRGDDIHDLQRLCETYGGGKPRKWRKFHGWHEGQEYSWYKAPDGRIIEFRPKR